MPPKKAPEPSKKTEMKKKEKIVEVSFFKRIHLPLVTNWRLHAAENVKHTLTQMEKVMLLQVNFSLSSYVVFLC